MLRRVHVPAVSVGEIALDPTQARHVRDVLRLTSGTIIEVFDNAGAVATGELIVAGQDVGVRIESVHRAPGKPSFEWTIASAVPKGERADWMVEKLSELGTAEFVPLAAARAVVRPGGKNKHQRWLRIATESAKQSRRVGVMRVSGLASVDDAIGRVSEMDGAFGWYLSTTDDARPISALRFEIPDARSLVAFIGPEGGWSTDELARFAAAGLTAVRLTDTVLRVETAAVATAAVIGSVVARTRPGDA